MIILCSNRYKKNTTTSVYDQYKIKSTKKRKILERRILGLKPTSAFKRRPRSIFEISKFKASELFNLLWFYLRYSLVGLLPTRITKHMEKLSAATFILCQKQTNVEQISTACEMLQQFAKEFEQIYGRGAVTMNIHLLHHYHKMILNCGSIYGRTICLLLKIISAY